MKNTPRDLFENVQFIKTCPLCNADYDKKDARILPGGGTTRMVHTTCSGCRSSILAVVTESAMGISSMGIMTDMNYDDLVHFRHEAPITADDCLDLHLLLNQQQTFNNLVQANAETYDLSIERSQKNRKTGSRARRG